MGRKFCAITLVLKIIYQIDINKTNDGPVMSNSNNGGMDSTSFKSILSGVKRMRDQYDVNELPNTNDLQLQQDLPTDRNIGNTTETAQDNPVNDEPQESYIGSSKDTSESDKSSKNSPSNTSHSRNNRHHTRINDVQTYTSIQVSNSQKGNPILTNSLMKTIPWSYNGSILSDYYINPTLQILFLSLKYHKLHPEYIWQRLKKMNKGSTIVTTANDRVLRMLLVVVDIDSHQEILRKLLNFCIKHDLSLVLAWSFEEAGNYIGFCKQYELATSKINLSIKGTKSSDYQACVVDTLTGIKSVNKTDSVKLLANCGSVKNIILQSCKGNEAGGLNNIQGLGARKLENMKSVFLELFIYNKDYDRK